MKPPMTNDSGTVLLSEEETTSKEMQIEKHDREDNPVITESEVYPETREFTGKTFAIELAGGAILGGLSIVFAVLVNPYMPTLPGMGMKIFDLIAIPMVLAYLVFGIRSGLLATITGCLGILILPEYMVWLGMIAKFSATIPMIVVPWLFFKTNKFLSSKIRLIGIIEETSENMKHIFPYIMTFTILIRTAFMFGMNLFVFIPLYSGGALSIVTDPRLSLLTATAYGLWNIVQGFGDAIIPYLLAYPTRFTKTFGTW